jgi:hypothetical protein
VAGHREAAPAGNPHVAIAGSPWGALGTASLAGLLAVGNASPPDDVARVKSRLAPHGLPWTPRRLRETGGTADAPDLGASTPCPARRTTFD